MWNYIMSSLTESLMSPPRSLSAGSSPEQSQSPFYKPKKTLYIISHDRHAPLSPPPDLQYDLRGVPNPPKSVRDRYTGHSRKVRKGLLQDRGTASSSNKPRRR
ncbi:hypothetical protein F5Y05DRAFT_394015 [Hypoxylon sp. FL0543]|nr:hypothetical protein F5Y05DRAFT_394015 [Hypoxylon sp. FL0543]